MFQAREFAELAGVTVRTLHHYDRLGLLKPKQRTESGYRLYEAQDLERLEQIVALKYPGLSPETDPAGAQSRFCQTARCFAQAAQVARGKARDSRSGNSGDQRSRAGDAFE